MADHTGDLFPHLDETVVATARYLGTLSELTDDDLRAPSLLPGWTRAHVVAHLALNADALTGVLHAAEAGEVGAMYPSREQRDADIETWAGRSSTDLRAESIAACGRWVQAANELHSSHLDAQATRVPGSTDTFPVRWVARLRRTEVEVHHADLGLGYTAADWPADFVESLLHRRERELGAEGASLAVSAVDTGTSWTVGSGGPEVSGPAAALVWWLIGRGAGEGLVSSSGELPKIGAWA